jgi:oligosaccharyltransferase complex subunit gamma
MSVAFQFLSVGMTKFLFVAFLLVTSLNSALGATKRTKAKAAAASKSNADDNINAGDERRKILVTKFLSQAIVPLTDSNFSKFITLRPRDYTAIIMFTALGAKYQCEICTRVLGTFTEVAVFYQNQYDFDTTEAKNRLAFFIMDVDTARSTFQDMQLETVPRFFILPPREEGSPKMKMGDYEFQVVKAIEGTGGIIGEIERLAGIKLVPTTNPKPLLIMLSAVAILLALLVSAASRDIGEAIFWYRNKYLWMTVTVICFCVGVSGSLFCYIRGAPNYAMEQRGTIRIFAGQGRDQYFIEGLIIAGWTVGCGFAAILLFHSTKMPFAIVRHVMVIFSLSLFIVLGIQIWEAYVEKTRWYQLKDTVPPELWNFLTSSVKKSSGLFKRLLRVSEIWIFDYKDWNGFTKKFKMLVVDYLKRSIFGASAGSS